MDPRALYQLTYGMYIVTAMSEGKHNGQTANTAFQISNDPPTIAVSINKDNLTHRFIDGSGMFLVTVLDDDAPLTLIGGFGFKSGRDTDKFEGVEYAVTSSGLRYPTQNALAYVEARVVGQADGNTHTVFLGQVTDAAVLAEGQPLTYAHYHLVKRGTSPKTAPIGIKSEG